MKQEQYKKLKDYEQHLATALYCDYARNVTQKGFEVLNAVYKEIFGKESGLGSGCGKCHLKALKELGKEYFAYKKKLEENMEKARQSKNKEPEVSEIDNVLEPSVSQTHENNPVENNIEENDTEGTEEQS